MKNEDPNRAELDNSALTRRSALVAGRILSARASNESIRLIDVTDIISTKIDGRNNASSVPLCVSQTLDDLEN